MNEQITPGFDQTLSLRLVDGTWMIKGWTDIDPRTGWDHDTWLPTGFRYGMTFDQVCDELEAINSEITIFFQELTS